MPRLATLPPIVPLHALAAALLSSPRLADAACRAAPTDHDPRHIGEAETAMAERHTRAVARCRRCPSLELCARAAPGLRDDGLIGFVVGGQVLQARPRGRSAPST